MNGCECACSLANLQLIPKAVVDLGAGNGILGIGALLLGAPRAIFVEVASLHCVRHSQHVLLRHLKLDKKSGVRSSGSGAGGYSFQSVGNGALVHNGIE